jgi:hypothetical protein
MNSKIIIDRESLESVSPKHGNGEEEKVLDKLALESIRLELSQRVVRCYGKQVHCYYSWAYSCTVTALCWSHLSCLETPYCLKIKHANDEKKRYLDKLALGRNPSGVVTTELRGVTENTLHSIVVPLLH